MSQRPTKKTSGLLFLFLMLAVSSFGCASNTQPQRAAEMQHQPVTRNVEAALEPYRDITVLSDNATAVTLIGTVKDFEERRTVLNLARSVPGVLSVTDSLSIRGLEPVTVGEYIDDSMITTAVKSRHLGQQGLDSLDISVETTDGVVTLSGQVGRPSQIALAETTANQADGVKRVINNLILKQ